MFLKKVRNCSVNLRCSKGPSRKCPAVTGHRENYFSKQVMIFSPNQTILMKKYWFKVSNLKCRNEMSIAKDADIEVNNTSKC